MDVWVDPRTGLRNRDFRPYISLEEQANSVYLYSPNSRGFNYGLYETAQPSCGSWLDIYYQYPSKVPTEVVDRTGRLHLIKPSWWRHGLRYEDLLKNARPT